MSPRPAERNELIVGREIAWWRGGVGKRLQCTMLGSIVSLDPVVPDLYIVMLTDGRVVKALRQELEAR